MADELTRLAGRNGNVWREYCRGATMDALAERYNISMQRVSQVIAQVADSIPQQERAALIAQEVDYMREVRLGILELWDSPAPPVTQRSGDGWEYVRDPEGRLAYDYSGRLHAANLALKYSERMHKLLGLEAATKVDIGASEEAASRLAAAEALAHLHGGTEEEAS